MLPYHLGCAKLGSPLYELADGRFQFIADSIVAPIMTGHQYALINSRLAEFLETLDLDQVRFEPAVIWNRQLGKEIHTHKRLISEKSISYEQIDELDLTGKQLYVMEDEYLFVSLELKDALVAQDFEHLQFSEGLSGFVAEAT